MLNYVNVLAPRACAGWLSMASPIEASDAIQFGEVWNSPIMGLHLLYLILPKIAWRHMAYGYGISIPALDPGLTS